MNYMTMGLPIICARGSICLACYIKYSLQTTWHFIFPPFNFYKLLCILKGWVLIHVTNVILKMLYPPMTYFSYFKFNWFTYFQNTLKFCSSTWDFKIGILYSSISHRLISPLGGNDIVNKIFFYSLMMPSI